MVENKRYKTILFCFVILCLVSTIAKSQDSIQQPIYKNTPNKHGSFYDWAWGTHYRNLYYKPITLKKISIDTIFKKLTLVESLPKLHAFILKDRTETPFLLKPIGGSASFLESNFFQSVYQKEDFKNTYLGDFINEAYTVVHPYMFLVSECLANSAGLGMETSEIAYIAKTKGQSAVTDSLHIQDKLISISQLSDLKHEKQIEDIATLLNKLQRDDFTKVDQSMYIKARLFDMLIGDWNKIPENWSWVSSNRGDSTIYTPQAIDRSYAFTKVDGFLFKELLNMLGVGFITNYCRQLKNIKKFNSLSFPLDIAITQKSNIDVWQSQARILKEQFTDDLIDNAFLRLPQEMQNEEATRLRKNLKSRRDNLEVIALKYYLLMQKTPVVTGTNNDDRFVIEQDENKNLHIRIYDKKTNTLQLDKRYNKKYTKEIWVYSLAGDDSFEVNKEKKSINVLLIGGTGTNEYRIEHGKNVSIYESKLEGKRLKSVTEAKLIIPNNEDALIYDYQQLRYSTTSFTPIGIYDSDLGLNLGTSVAYTLYGFRRAPYTRRHQISYDYKNGFTYQGIFPSYDEKKSLHVAAFLGSPRYFSNFFGFGNNTDGYKDAKKYFNRVNIHKYMLTPALYYNIDNAQTLNVHTSFEIYEVKNPQNRDRFINQVYDDDHSIFSKKHFMDFGITYQINKNMKHVVSSFQFLFSSGWTVNITNPKRNFAYINSDFGINLKLTDRITFATLLKGKFLFSDDYEFYQAATTELRGFRNNRFIGQQSFYQYSDIRLDMGRLHNPLTPLHYGVFAGIDHGRVWYPQEESAQWHSSYGGGFWLTLLRKFTGKFSYFGSTDAGRFMFELGMGF